MKKNNKYKCDFCNKKSDNLVAVKDNYKTYYICAKCNERVTEYFKEYTEKSKKVDEVYHKKLTQLNNRLRKKYNLKKY